MLTALEAMFDKYRFTVFNRVVYFNYAIISLFAQVQLANFDTSSTLNVLSAVVSLIVLVLLLYYALRLRE